MAAPAWLTPYLREPDEGHIDALDGVRVLCVLLVGWFHIWQQSWLTPRPFGQSLDFVLRSGYIWVDGLLLLSGFLLYLPYAGGKKIKPMAFYKRRFLRVFPSYFLCVAVMLLFVALPQGSYKTFWEGARDVLAHLTFTHTLFEFSYYGSPLNGALWTLGVEMQFYLIFPLLMVCFRKKPLITYLAMTAGAFAFRYFASLKPDTGMYFNQLPAFLDVYANGFVAAAVFHALRGRLKNQDRYSKLLFTAVCALCVAALIGLMRGQAAENGTEAIRLGQMARRFPLSATLGVFMVCAPLTLPAARFLLGNPLMRFLSGVSFQFYIWHQVLAVRLRAWGFPPSQSPVPNQAGEQPWQTQYTLCCFGGALLIATLVTYLFERPIARRFGSKKSN